MEKKKCTSNLKFLDLFVFFNSMSFEKVWNKLKSAKDIPKKEEVQRLHSYVLSNPHAFRSQDLNQHKKNIQEIQESLKKEFNKIPEVYKDKLCNVLLEKDAVLITDEEYCKVFELFLENNLTDVFNTLNKSGYKCQIPIEITHFYHRVQDIKKEFKNNINP